MYSKYCSGSQQTLDLLALGKPAAANLTPCGICSMEYFLKLPKETQSIIEGCRIMNVHRLAVASSLGGVQIHQRFIVPLTYRSGRVPLTARPVHANTWVHIILRQLVVCVGDISMVPQWRQGMCEIYINVGSSPFWRQ